MRRISIAVLFVTALTLTGCRLHRRLHGESGPLTPARAAAVDQEVRAFMSGVARDVTQKGPAVWSEYFEDSPSFFMAVNGQLAFPSGAAAMAALPSVAAAYKSIDLQWGDSLRVDPLAPGLAVVAAPYHEIQVNSAGRRVEENGYFSGVAELRDGRWKFRDAHWSSAPPAHAP